MKFPKVKEAIMAGTSDLFIHRSIASNFLIDNLPPDWLQGMTLKHSIAMVIVSFLPRHQLWGQVKTRVITPKTKNWHSSDLFSEETVKAMKENIYFTEKYHGEFDIDEDWECLHELQRQRDMELSLSADGDDEEDYSDSESDDILISDDAESSDDMEEEHKYGEERRTVDYSTASHSHTDTSHSSVSSLSDDDMTMLSEHRSDRARLHRKKRRRNRTHHIEDDSRQDLEQNEDWNCWNIPRWMLVHALLIVLIAVILLSFSRK